MLYEQIFRFGHVEGNISLIEPQKPPHPIAAEFALSSRSDSLSGDGGGSAIKQYELVQIASLTPHPRNYQAHPADEIEHIQESIKEHGFYRNIVISQGNTILAGHGVVEAARKLGYEQVPAIRVDYSADDPRAIKLLIGDNEIRHLAEVDDRALTELLRELKDINDINGLLGTGYDEMMLANLAMVTRPESEIEDMDAAAQWVGLPEYDEGEDRIQIIVNFATEEDCQEFCHKVGFEKGKEAVKGAKKSFWWPVRGMDDVSSLLFASGTSKGVHDDE